MRPQSFTLCRNTCKHSTSNQAKWARPPNNQVSRVTQWTRRRWRTPCLTDKTQRDHRNEAVTRAWKRRSRCRREARQLTRRGRLAKKAAVARPHSWSTILSSWSSEIPKGKPKYLEVGTNGYAAKQPGSKESERPSTQDLETLMLRPRSASMETTWGKRRRVWATDLKRRIASSMNQRAHRDKASATKTGRSPLLHQWLVSCSKRAATIRPNRVGLWLPPCWVPRFWSHHHEWSNSSNRSREWTRSHRSREALKPVEAAQCSFMKARIEFTNKESKAWDKSSWTNTGGVGKSAEDSAACLAMYKASGRPFPATDPKQQVGTAHWWTTREVASKRNFLFKASIFKVHVRFQGGEIA